jgi:hypothetical protein
MSSISVSGTTEESGMTKLKGMQEWLLLNGHIYYNELKKPVSH